MDGTSKWVKWYRALAIIGCGAIVVVSIISGLKNWVPGCAIAAVELILSMMLCEFFDNVSIIAYKLCNPDYINATQAIIEEFTHNPKTKEVFNNIRHEKEATHL